MVETPGPVPDSPLPKSLAELANAVRRRRLDPLAVRVHELAQALRRQFGGTPTAVEALADALPLAAWVVWRKGRRLLGETMPAEPEPPALPFDAVPDLEPAVAWLEDRYRAAYAYWGVRRWPPAPPPPVAGATLDRLLGAWPSGRRPRAVAEAQVVLSDPLWRGGIAVVRWLRRFRGRPFQDLLSGLDRPRQVEYFWVLVALWARGRVEVDQAAPYGPLRVHLRPVRGEGRLPLTRGR
jgi:hypothetical protein